MIFRTSTIALALVLALGCKNRESSSQVGAGQPAAGSGSGSATGSNAGSSAAPGSGAPVPGTVDTKAGSGSAGKPVIHGEKWSDDTEGGGKAFKAFRETWVYVDGVPKGVLLLPELPVSMKPAWFDDIEGLDFKAGDPGPHEKKIQILRWRLDDYLKTLGVDIAKIKYVYIQGSGMVAIPGDTFRKFAPTITFDFTGNNMAKTRFYWSVKMPTNTSYDRYAAVSVFIEKPPLKIDEHNNPFIGDVEVNGIPYFGTPLRGGFRVYVDDKLALIIKRNELTTVGRTNLDKPDEDPRWSLYKLLEATGIKGEFAGADLALSRDFTTQTRQRLDEGYIKDLEFSSPSLSSGGLAIGKDKLEGTALRLYTKGHLPKFAEIPPRERDWQPPGK